MAQVSFARLVTDLAAAAPDRPSVTCGDQRLTRRSSSRRPTGSPATCSRRRGSRRHGHDRASQLGSTGSSPSLRRGSWAPFPQPVSASLPAREMAAIVELADPPVMFGVDARRVSRPPLPAHRLPTSEPISTTGRSPMSIVARVEGADIGRFDRQAEADRVRRPGGHRSRQPAHDADPARGCLVMPGPLYHNGPLVWACQALLSGGHVVVLPRFDAEATLAAIEKHTGRGDLPRAHDDEADLATTRGDAPALRPLVAATRVASGRAVPAVAQGSVDRVARARAHRRVVRRHRGPGRHRHQRCGVARAPRFGRQADDRRADDLRRRGQRAAARRDGRSVDAPDAARHPRTATLAPRRAHSKVGGSRSATWATSTRRATSTSATASRT